MVLDFLQTKPFDQVNVLHPTKSYTKSPNHSKLSSRRFSRFKFRKKAGRSARRLLCMFRSRDHATCKQRRSFGGRRRSRQDNQKFQTGKTRHESSSKPVLITQPICTPSNHGVCRLVCSSITKKDEK